MLFRCVLMSYTIIFYTVYTVPCCLLFSKYSSPVLKGPRCLFKPSSGLYDGPGIDFLKKWILG